VAWDVNQIGNPTNKLYFRSANSGGWDPKWKHVLTDEDIEKFDKDYTIPSASTVKIGTLEAGSQFVALVSFGNGDSVTATYAVHFTDSAATDEERLYTVLLTPCAAVISNCGSFAIIDDKILFITLPNSGVTRVKIQATNKIEWHEQEASIMYTDMLYSSRTIHDPFASPIAVVSFDDQLVITESKMAIKNKTCRKFGGVVNISFAADITTTVTLSNFRYIFGNISQYTPNTPIYSTGTIYSSADKTSKFCGVELSTGGDLTMISSEALIPAGNIINASFSYIIE
jgi:hypothetical protein